MAMIVVGMINYLCLLAESALSNIWLIIYTVFSIAGLDFNIFCLVRGFKYVFVFNIYLFVKSLYTEWQSFWFKVLQNLSQGFLESYYKNMCEPCPINLDAPVNNFLIILDPLKLPNHRYVNWKTCKWKKKKHIY